jgi:hypothetical protein
VADQSDCAGVEVGVGVGVELTEADGNGDGDGPDVEKFGLSASLVRAGTVMGWARILVTLAGAAAVCASAFVFAAVLVASRAFVPVCVAPAELPFEPASPGAVPPV